MKQYLVNAIILLSIVGIIFFLIVNKRYKDTDSDEQLIEPKINHNTTPDIAEDEMDTEDAIVSEGNIIKPDRKHDPVIKKIEVTPTVSKSMEITFSDLTEVDGVLRRENDTKPYTGDVYEYFRNGKLRQRGYIKRGVKNGSFTEWHDNGEKSAEIKYKNGIKNGSYKLWYYTGIIKEKGTSKHGLLHGELVQYHNNGKKMAERTYVNGKQTGSYTIWFKNGTVQEKGEYNNDQKVGEFKKQYSNGETEVKGTYDNGLKQGWWIHWNDQGKITKRIPYDRNKIDGSYTKYLNNGKIALHREYSSGAPRGKWDIGSKLKSNQLEDIYNYTIKSVKDDDIKTSIRLLNSLLGKYPFPKYPIGSKAHLQLATIYHKSVIDLDRALKEYGEVFEKYEETEEQPLALFQIIQIYKCELRAADIEKVKRIEFMKFFSTHKLAGNILDPCL